MMTDQDMLNLTKLQEHYNTKRKFCYDKKILPTFSKAICFRFVSKKPYQIELKQRMNKNFLEMNLQKRGRASLSMIHKKNIIQIKINRKRLKDVKTFLQYVPPIYHGYYNSLVPKEEDNEDKNVLD